MCERRFNARANGFSDDSVYTILDIAVIGVGMAAAAAQRCSGGKGFGCVEPVRIESRTTPSTSGSVKGTLSGRPRIAAPNRWNGHAILVSSVSGSVLVAS